MLGSTSLAASWRGPVRRTQRKPIVPLRAVGRAAKRNQVLAWKAKSNQEPPRTTTPPPGAGECVSSQTFPTMSSTPSGDSFSGWNPTGRVILRPWRAVLL